QYEQFRGDRIQALGRVLEAERNLRGLLNLPVEDCKRLVPSDAPTLSRYNPDWCTALNEGLSLRPELVIARQDLKIRQLDVIREKNNLLPDLRFASSYNIRGVGSRLDGNSTLTDNPNTGQPGLPENSLRSLAHDHFNDWNLGLTLSVPIGFRAAHAALR